MRRSTPKKREKKVGSCVKCKFCRMKEDISGPSRFICIYPKLKRNEKPALCRAERRYSPCAIAYQEGESTHCTYEGLWFEKADRNEGDPIPVLDD